jgi:hypothetical protein
MGTETPNPGGQPKQPPPGNPGIQPPREDDIDKDIEDGQDIPKTGRDASEPTEQDDDESPTESDDDETGKIELPGEGGGDDQADRSRSADNP